MDKLYSQLKSFGRVKPNEPLAKYTTFKIGGPAMFLVEVDETEKLVGLLNFLVGEGIDYFILSGGSNLLLPDEGVDGVVVKVKSQKLKVSAEGGSASGGKSHVIEAEAGVLLGAVMNLAMQSGLSGLEWAMGVPGSVGGAVCGNAGAMGCDTRSVTKDVEVWRDGEVITCNRDECGFAYRESVFKYNKDVILKARFELKPGGKAEILSTMQTYLKQRAGKYPLYPSAGSLFKNVKLEKWPGDKSKLPQLFLERGTVPVGWLVEQVGVKGFTVGGAKVSDEHGNFIINFNKATQKDVLAVVEEVRKRVYNNFGVELESEVEIVEYNLSNNHIR